MDSIKAPDALRLKRGGKLPLLDVRAPVEFAKGHLPGSRNGPILEDEERHEIGIRYKQAGQAAAIALGHELVDPARPARVEAWARALREEKTELVACWRGGLRSGLAQEWLQEAGVRSVRVEGGYKALRAELLRAIALPRPGLVLAGATGVGKTTFLRALDAGSTPTLDLEGLAAHRGSSFGGLFSTGQPAQQTFENGIGLNMFHLDSRRPLLVEDESRLVGRCVVPDDLFHQMRAWPRLVLEATAEERVQNLRREYVEEPLRELPPSEVEQRLAGALLALRNRLGGADTQEILLSLREAFAGRGSHEAWIEALLTRYYDPLYAHSAARSEGAIEQRGNAAALRAYLAQRPAP